MTQIRNIVAAIFITSVLVLIGEYSYYRFMPIKHFVHYKGVSQVGIAKAGEPITFVSSLKVRAGVKLVWSDILRCKKTDGEQFGKMSSQPFAKSYSERRDWTDEDSVWQYSETGGGAGDYCYLEYGPKVHLPYFIIRTYPQEISEVFQITGDK